MNKFVQYLDQYNVLSPNHANIYDEYAQTEQTFSFAIETKIESFLVSLYQERPCSVIMTGNAGDGKTRLCRVVYERLTGIELNKWSEAGIEEVPFAHGKIRIVKDLSELTEEAIFEELTTLQRRVADGHADRVYYLIAANEGKLTKSLSQYMSLNPLADLVQKRFLDHRSNDKHLHLVNLQDVSSSLYADRILSEWNKESYWEACDACSKKSHCIIALNHKRMSHDAVRRTLVEQYRLLDCLGTHVTMREMLIHLSYTITGGLTCDDVLKAGYKEIESQAGLAYYDNFYGVQLSQELAADHSAIRHFRGLDPGQLSISSIDDFLLHGDISSEAVIAERHRTLFEDDIDMLFGYYRKQIDCYRMYDREGDTKQIFCRMPKFRRKYFFECNEADSSTSRKLVPYLHFYRFLDCLNVQPTGRQMIRRELMRGLNHAFTKRLIGPGVSHLYAVNENLMIHADYATNQFVLTLEDEREDLDYIPSRLFLTVDRQVRMELRLSAFEYLLRLSSGGLLFTLKQEVEILLQTFKNELINRSEPDEYGLHVFSLDSEQGVFTPQEIQL